VTNDGPVVEVERVGPDPRLLVLLVAVLSIGVAWMFLTSGDDDTRRVTLGSIEDVAEQAAAGPVRIADLPHLVVVRTAVRDSPILQARWGENTGTVLLSSREQLVVLETVDPQDGEPLVWCATRGVFEHPDGERMYAPDGLLLTGDGLRGMDRRAIGLTGPALLEVDDARWVSGLARRATHTAFAPRGASCVG
jgi:hypothetical protein